MFSFYPIQLISWLLLFGASIASSWFPSSRVIALYWYYKKYYFKVCVISFSFYSIQLLSWLLFFGSRISFSNCHRHKWVRYIANTKIKVWCMSLLLLSIDLQWFCYFIMFYFKMTNGAMVKWWMVKLCNGEIKIRIGRFVSHKYRFCSFVLFSNTTFLQQTKQSITFNFWSLTTSTETEFMLSNQATTERRDLSGVRLLLWGILGLWFKSFGFSNLRKYTTTTKQCYRWPHTWMWRIQYYHFWSHFEKLPGTV